MHNAFSAILGFIAPLSLAATISNATTAPPAKAAEDRYIAARDAAIEKISAIYDAGNADDAALKAEEAASADLAANLRQKGEDEYKRCFTQNAPKQPSFAAATRQAERLLSAALNMR